MDGDEDDWKTLSQWLNTGLSQEQVDRFEASCPSKKCPRTGPRGMLVIRRLSYSVETLAQLSPPLPSRQKIDERIFKAL